MLENALKKLKLILIPCQENQYRPKFLDGNFLIYCVLFLFILKLFIFPLSLYLQQGAFFASLTESALITLTNQERQSLGLSPLNSDPKLEDAAYRKARDMIEHGYFSHQGPDGETPWSWFKKAEYDYKSAGENLAIGFLDADEVFYSWKNSPAHKANIVSPKYQDIGIAVVKGQFQGKEVAVVVQHFGSKINDEVKEEIIKEAKTEEVIIEKVIIEKTTEEVKEKQETDVAGASSVLQTEKNAPVLGWLGFIMINYSDILRNIILCVLFFVVIVLMSDILIKVDIQYPDLILKTIFLILILVLFVFLDKQVMLQLIPHSLSII